MCLLEFRQEDSTTPEPTFFVDVFQKAEKLFDFPSTVPSNTKSSSIDHSLASTEIANVTEWEANPVAPRTTINFTEYSSTIDDRDDSLLNSTIFEQNNTIVTFPISLTSSAPKINIEEQVSRITVEMTATEKPTDTKSTDSSNFKEVLRDDKKDAIKSKVLKQINVPLSAIDLISKEVDSEEAGSTKTVLFRTSTTETPVISTTTITNLNSTSIHDLVENVKTSQDKESAILPKVKLPEKLPVLTHPKSENRLVTIGQPVTTLGSEIAQYSSIESSTYHSTTATFALSSSTSVKTTIQPTNSDEVLPVIALPMSKSKILTAKSKDSKEIARADMDNFLKNVTKCTQLTEEQLIKELKQEGTYNPDFMAWDVRGVLNFFEKASTGSYDKTKKESDRSRIAEQNLAAVEALVKELHLQNCNLRTPEIMAKLFNVTGAHKSDNEAKDPSETATRRFLARLKRSAVQEDGSKKKAPKTNEKLELLSSLNETRKLKDSPLKSSSKNSDQVIKDDPAIIGQAHVVPSGCRKRGTAEDSYLRLCGMCHVIRHLPDTYFPPFINEVACDEDKALLSLVTYGIGVQMVKNSLLTVLLCCVDGIFCVALIAGGATRIIVDEVQDLSNIELTTTPMKCLYKFAGYYILGAEMQSILILSIDFELLLAMKRPIWFRNFKNKKCYYLVCFSMLFFGTISSSIAFIFIDTKRVQKFCFLNEFLDGYYLMYHALLCSLTGIASSIVTVIVVVLYKSHKSQVSDNGGQLRRNRENADNNNQVFKVSISLMFLASSDVLLVSVPNTLFTIFDLIDFDGTETKMVHLITGISTGFRCWLPLLINLLISKDFRGNFFKLFSCLKIFKK
uniref:G-protein coupled receptors family 1 profile domain-containing protein n=1 Tax=Romanomermis culicivorax TaxID=13658 RepID=A0A915HXN9_ROMCU